MTEGASPARASALDSFLTSVNNIQLLVAAVVAQIVPALLALSVSSAVAKLLAGLLAVAILIGVYLLWRAAEKRRSAKALLDKKREAWGGAHAQAAFRGLYSYTRRDELPGRKRQKLARTIATSVANPTFRYGLVTGDVGSGKSSLLDSAVCKELESIGHSVALVRGLQDCSGDRTLDAVIAQLRELLEPASGDRVLVIDQFEEMLIEWPSRDARQRLGAFLHEPLPGQRVRVICSLRSDYLLGMHDLAPALPEPTAWRSTFPVDNLEIQEAAEIIEECSARDGMEIDPALARIIAADLSHGGSVRPPELQLVCQGLSGAEPEKVYRENGGAQGILSDYVKKAVEISPAPDLARLALRALCNFDATPPAKMPPQSAREIANAVGTPLAGAAAVERLQRVVTYLVNAGLIKVIGTAEPVYSLTHDYLVQPVILATSDASTQAERATQLLKLHLAEYAADPKTRIPVRRLRFIPSHADRELLASSPARALLRRSYAAGAATAGLFVSVAAIGVAAIILWQSSRWQWERALVGTHAPDGAPQVVSFVATTDGKEVISRTSGGDQGFISWWDARTALPLFRSRGEVVGSRVNRDALLFQVGPSTDSRGNRLSRRVRVLRRSARGPGDSPRRPMAFATRLSATKDDQLEIGPTNDEVISRERRLGMASEAPIMLRMWGLTEGRMILSRTLPTTVGSVALGRGRNLAISELGDGGLNRLWLWNPRTERTIQLDSTSMSVERTGRFGTGGTHDGGSRPALILWNVATGELTRHPFGDATPRPLHLFTRDARHLIVGSYAAGVGLHTVQVYTVPDMVRIKRVRSLALAAIANSEDGFEPYFILPGPESRAAVWDFRRLALVPLDIPYSGIALFLLSRDRSRALILSEGGTIALFDTQTWRRIATPQLPDRAMRVQFTPDGFALSVITAGGALTLLDASTGALINTFTDVSGVSVAYHDRDCQRVHFWTEEGRVLRYTRGRSWPFFGFRPERRCS